MALSKQERVNQIDQNAKSLSISLSKILQICQVTYTNAISIEIIDHLLGGENMDYIMMEVQDSFDCYNYCRQDLLENIKSYKKELVFFEDRKNKTSSIIVAITKQPRMKTTREHLTFYAVV